MNIILQNNAMEGRTCLLEGCRNACRALWSRLLRAQYFKFFPELPRTQPERQSFSPLGALCFSVRLTLVISAASSCLWSREL